MRAAPSSTRTAMSIRSPATSPPEVVTSTASGGSPASGGGNSTRSGSRLVEMAEPGGAVATAKPISATRRRVNSRAPCRPCAARSRRSARRAAWSIQIAWQPPIGTSCISISVAAARQIGDERLGHDMLDLQARRLIGEDARLLRRPAAGPCRGRACGAGNVAWPTAWYCPPITPNGITARPSLTSMPGMIVWNGRLRGAIALGGRGSCGSRCRGCAAGRRFPAP